jgi:hypothetical protein
VRPVAQTQPAAQRVLEATIAPLLEVIPDRWEPAADAFDIELERWAADVGLPPMPGALLRQAFIGWTRLHGVLSLEIEGHFSMGLPDPEKLYAAEVDTLARELREVLD